MRDTVPLPHPRKAVTRNLLLRTSLVLAGLFAQLPLSKATAVEPFAPDNTPSCPSAVRQGAQNAIDLFLTEHRVKLQESEKKLRQELFAAQNRGESTVGIETRIDLAKTFNRYHLEKAASDKAAELQAFALKKYGCRLHLFYVVP
jgi:hypothetical protein